MSALSSLALTSFFSLGDVAVFVIFKSEAFGDPAFCKSSKRYDKLDSRAPHENDGGKAVLDKRIPPPDGGGATHVNIFQNYYKITKSKCGGKGGVILGHFGIKPLPSPPPRRGENYPNANPRVKIVPASPLSTQCKRNYYFIFNHFSNNRLSKTSS